MHTLIIKDKSIDGIDGRNTHACMQTHAQAQTGILCLVDEDFIIGITAMCINQLTDEKKKQTNKQRKNTHSILNSRRHNILLI